MQEDALLAALIRNPGLERISYLSWLDRELGLEAFAQVSPFLRRAEPAYQARQRQRDLHRRLSEGLDAAWVALIDDGKLWYVLLHTMPQEVPFLPSALSQLR